MTPQEKHQDAVAAAREWSAEQRERLSLPRDGELIPIRWPDGEHDFVMQFMYEDTSMAGHYPGWHWLHGVIVEPPSWQGRSWSLMVHWVVSKDEQGNDTSAWTMLPKNGKISDVEP
jgi:hypothetical protein